MPSKEDKPQPNGNGFPNPGANNLYASSKNIWNNSSYAPSHARGPSLSRDPLDNGPTNGMATNGWNRTNYPWNASESRSTSASPNRTRDNGLSRGSAFANGEAQAPVGMKNGLNGLPNGYNDPLQKRQSNDTSAYGDPLLSTFPTRDPNAPPSRHSQASPGFPDPYNGRSHKHSHSNSFSTRAVTNNSSLHQAANSRAFNMNRQIDEDLTAQLGSRRSTVDHSAMGGLNVDMTTQPFQFNPNTQSFGQSNGNGHANGNSHMDALASQYGALNLKRPSTNERVSPVPSGYRLENGNSPRGLSQTPSDPWNSSRSSSRDPRTNDFERRGSSQQGLSAYNGGSYFPPQQQYPYPQLPQQFASANYVEQYNQLLRHPMLPNYPLPFPSYNMPTMAGTMPPPMRPAEADPTRGLRSQALEEFRNNKNRKCELRDFFGHMVEFSGDQHGSRFIQAKLESANSDEKDTVFREIEPNAVQLMKDVFGNYVVQKFFEHGNQFQKKVLADKIKPQMATLSLQVYACRVVQKALEHVLVDQQLELVKELEPEALRITLDQNGNHVMQKVIGLLDRKNLDFMMAAIRGQVMMLSCHQYGCRVVQRMMDHGTEEDNEIIIKEIRPSAHLLLPDQFGNYVAQHIIVHGKFEDRLRMVNLVLDQLVDLCKHKFASNVVETCIIHGVPELRTAIRNKFEEIGSDGNTILQQLMRDSYGNYVVQKMATFLTGTEQDRFVEQLKPTFYVLKKGGNTRQLQAMEKMLDLHARNELVPDEKTYGHVKPLAPAPGMSESDFENASGSGVAASGLLGMKGSSR